MKRAVVLGFPDSWTDEMVHALDKVTSGTRALVNDESSAFMGWRLHEGNGFLVDPDFEKQFGESGWMLRDVLVIVRATPIATLGGLPRAYDLLYWFVRDPDRYYFNLDPVRIKNVTGDKRNHPKGKNPGNVWRFQAGQRVLTAQPAKERPQRWWLAPAFVERCIKSTTERGDPVLEPLRSLPGLRPMCERLGRILIES